MTDGDDLPMYAPLNSKRGELGKVTRADVVAEGRALIGVPYVHQGRSLHGLDCVGLPILVCRNLGLIAPDFDVNGYQQTPDGKTMLEICDRYMVRIPMHLLQPGDVLVYSLHRKLGPQHMGIVGDYMHGGLSLIQALGTTDGKGRVVEWSIASPRKGWMPVQAYKIPGVA